MERKALLSEIIGTRRDGELQRPENITIFVRISRDFLATE
jgi:hypothetical protein